MNRKLNVLSALLLATTAICGEPAHAASATRAVVPMEAHPTDPREPAASDRSILTRNDTGVVAEIRTSNLDRAAYTVWWVIFNNPEYCMDLPCTADDLPANGGDEKVEASIVPADGALVGNSGQARFFAALTADDDRLALFGPGLVDPRGAELHLLVRTHGTPIPELLHEQISTTAGGCPPNSCGDQQFAVHLP